MKRIDFLSGSPKALIFGNKANKTSLGGTLTIIYLIIVLLITLAYFYDFELNSKYSVLYTYEHTFLNETEAKNKEKDPNLNPKIKFRVTMNVAKPKNFFVATRNGKNRYIHDIGEECEYNVYDFFLYIGYRCSNSTNGTYNCSLRKEDERYTGYNMYEYFLNYNGTKIDHYNKDSPLLSENISEYYHFDFEDKITFFAQKWKSIRYTEIKGMIGTFEKSLGISNDEHYGGIIMNDKTVIASVQRKEVDFWERNGFRILSIIKIIGLNENNIDNYARSEKGIFDPISNIFSLCLAIYNALTFIFCGYYSNNFDNYQIVEKILSKNIKKPIELSSDFNLKDDLLIENIDDNENIKTSKYINDKRDKNELNKEKNRILPRLHFYDFFFNNIYTKKCCSSNKQELLTLCDNIISKYFTVDYIIYNQMNLENLFKDYKWNDPSLNNIENNDMINELKLYIRNILNN